MGLTRVSDHASGGSWQVVADRLREKYEGRKLVTAMCFADGSMGSFQTGFGVFMEVGRIHLVDLLNKTGYPRTDFTRNLESR